jgi:hypothetical protein
MAAVKNPRAGPGRPKGALNKITVDIRALAQQHGPMAIRELVRLVQSAENEGTRVAAIKELLDRAYGKAPQPMDGDGRGGPIQTVVTIVFGS